jgi:hypothetical protein
LVSKLHTPVTNWANSPAPCRVAKDHSEDGIERHTHQDRQNIGNSPASNAGKANDSFFASRSPIVAPGTLIEPRKAIGTGHSWRDNPFMMVTAYDDDERRWRVRELSAAEFHHQTGRFRSAESAAAGATSTTA